MTVNRRGPAPKPTALRVLHGDRADRINTQEPKPAPGVPDCPAHVSDEVREVWDYTIEQLEKMSCVAVIDRDMLVVYCEAVVLHRYASQVLSLKADLMSSYGTGAFGHAVRVQRDAAMMMARYGAAFGLTPAARSTIKVGDKPGDATGAERFLSA